jgi:hypothetical protein
MLSIKLKQNEHYDIEYNSVLKDEVNESNIHEFRNDILHSKYDFINFNLKHFNDIDVVCHDVKYISLNNHAPLKEVVRLFPNIQSVGLSNIKNEVDLGPLADLKFCRKLSIYKSIVISSCSFPKIKCLSIVNQSIQELFLSHFDKIESLSLGTTKYVHLNFLKQLIKMRYFYIGWEKGGTEHLDDLSGLHNLQSIYTFRASKLSHLPDLKNNVNFKAASLNESHKLSDISGLYEAPNLEILSIVDCRSLKPEDFYPFKGHPTLRHIYWGAFPRDQERVIAHLGDIWNPELSNMEYVLPDLI